MGTGDMNRAGSGLGRRDDATRGPGPTSAGARPEDFLGYQDALDRKLYPLGGRSRSIHPLCRGATPGIRLKSRNRGPGFLPNSRTHLYIKHKRVNMF